MLHIEEEDKFELPPNECPSCGAPYRVGDFGSSLISCRKCGRTIHVGCVVSDDEVIDLLRTFVAKYKKENGRLFAYGLPLLFFIIAVVSCCHVGSFLEFLYSWHVCWLYFAIGLFYAGRDNDKMLRYFTELEAIKRPSLFDIELRIKEEEGEDGSNTALFYDFKDKLTNLYRRSARSVKGRELA